LRFGNTAFDLAARMCWQAGLRLTPDRVVDTLLRIGRYRLSLARVQQALHGIDLGPLQPQWKRKVRTASGRVELAPAALVDDLARVHDWLALSGGDGQGLVLIGRRDLRSNNSWLHNVRSLVKGPDRTALYMSPVDADKRGLGDGETVRVTSTKGTVTARLSVSDVMMPGVVSLPHGWGHASAADSLRVAGPLGGPNLNTLTDEDVVDPLTGTAALNGVPVEVTAHSGGTACGAVTAESVSSNAR
jgi:anaerobic selenocysteine-containing dehydrogenase